MCLIMSDRLNPTTELEDIFDIAREKLGLQKDEEITLETAMKVVLGDSLSRAAISKKSRKSVWPTNPDRRGKDEKSDIERTESAQIRMTAEEKLREAIYGTGVDRSREFDEVFFPTSQVDMKGLVEGLDEKTGFIIFRVDIDPEEKPLPNIVLVKVPSIVSGQKEFENELVKNIFARRFDERHQNDVLSEQYSTGTAIINDEEVALLKAFNSLDTNNKRLVEAFTKSLMRPPLPETAPKEYSKRKDRSESPVDFIRRVYATWLATGIPRPHLKKIDGKLYVGLQNWLRQNELPSDVNLPKRSDEFDDIADHLIENGVDLSEAGLKLLSLSQGLMSRNVT